MSIDVVQPTNAAQADTAINNHVALAMGAGLIPLPLVDVAAVTAIQIKLLNELSGIYKIEFSENRVKAIVGSLLTGLGSGSVAAYSVGSVAKFVPGLGSILGVVTLPVIAGAFTYAIGKVFTQHFESGGTFLSFDSLDAKAGFAREFEKGKTYVSQTAKSVGTKFADTSTKIENKLDAVVETVCR